MARDTTVQVAGMDLLGRRLDRMPAAVQEGARRAVAAETRETADDMREGAPRDTGALAESVQEEIDAGGLTGRAVATARHATFVEHGTEDTPEQPFAQPAAERARRRFPARVKQATGVSLRKLAR
ncbi:HK97 gp10 family phage protein [Micromonospora sp. Llam0]|uniref:HK97-gp10 family putative phage morphogenesis protein n=1 Tax=Micromonospora sp. Llam0 TaxID=2485143 RepID=UPI000FACBC53|nr:HK97-gp10 family putative phage morphogenesis protein [Micromonospora sp. Llam0]ROO51463.1 HK97 gp10 family phage protein [Micromonospora sp. Llam0]